MISRLRCYQNIRCARIRAAKVETTYLSIDYPFKESFGFLGKAISPVRGTTYRNTIHPTTLCVLLDTNKANSVLIPPSSIHTSRHTCSPVRSKIHEPSRIRNRFRTGCLADGM